MTHMIKIGLSPCFMHPDMNRSVFGPKTLSYYEHDMVNFFSSKKSLPFLIPMLDDDSLSVFMGQIDAIVLQGGADLAPESYGEEPIDAKRWPGDRMRDLYEFKILDLAIKMNKPILGICRGFQVINAYFGGTLYQDLPTQLPSKTVHRDAITYDKIKHSIEIKKDSLLKDIYGEEEIIVNSVHHQGIKTLGNDLIIEAVSPEENLIEAFRYKDMDEQFLYAVQWHPEFSHSLNDEVNSPTPLLEYFLKAIIK